GLLALLLGWRCFDQVLRVRALYSEERPRHSRFQGEKPLMIVPSALGALLVLAGLSLLTLAAAGWLAALSLVPAGVATSTPKVNPAACAP
ncbi:MAG TPA: hypothetical protein VNZ44_08780, partial [Pyrinomonadaceae bacterium]|nr:hypothetical protein [Pyrinomonadaceae bacterium]